MSASQVTPQVTPYTNTEELPAFLTAQEAADLLRVSTDTIMRWFGDLPGVFAEVSPEDVRGRKRRYRTIRIPRTVFKRFIREHTIE